MRCACLCRPRGVSSRHWSRRWKRHRSSTSAGRSRDCRWRWSLQRHGRGCCRAMRSPPSCVRAPSLLHAVDAAHPARHASIEVVFDQSWRLLSEIERDALSRLSVFRGGFSAEAARAIAGASLPVLGALADKSLLRKDGTRILLHPLVQQLAAARLARARRMRADAGGARRVLPSAAGAAAIRCRTQASVRRCRRSTSSSRTAGARGPGRSSIDQADALDAQLSDPARLPGLPRPLRRRTGVAARSHRIADSRRQTIELHSLLLSRASHLEYRLDRYADAEASASRALAATRQQPRLRHENAGAERSCDLRVANWAGWKTPGATSSRCWMWHRPKTRPTA